MRPSYDAIEYSATDQGKRYSRPSLLITSSFDVPVDYRTSIR